MTDDEPLVGADPGKLRDVKVQELLTRFAFGVSISIAAGVVSIVVNPVAGGMFLAFPAILPATVTLIEKREGTTTAAKDVQGAVIGAGALVPFAGAAGLLLSRAGAPVALVVALFVWLLVSVTGYLAVEIALRRRSQQGQRGRRLRPSRCRNATRAAWNPHVPWTPPPGGVDAEQR